MTDTDYQNSTSIRDFTPAAPQMVFRCEFCMSHRPERWQLVQHLRERHSKRLLEAKEIAATVRPTVA
jgi:hypothetical protein